MLRSVCFLARGVVSGTRTGDWAIGVLVHTGVQPLLRSLRAFDIAWVVVVRALFMRL